MKFYRSQKCLILELSNLKKIKNLWNHKENKIKLNYQFRNNNYGVHYNIFRNKQIF